MYLCACVYASKDLCICELLLCIKSPINPVSERTVPPSLLEGEVPGDDEDSLLGGLPTALKSPKLRADRVRMAVVLGFRAFGFRVYL